MAKVSNGSALSSSLPSSEPAIRVFSDDELSEIFQIDFGQIFGNPESGLKSSYRGIQSKRGVSRSNSAGIASVPSVTLPAIPLTQQFGRNNRPNNRPILDSFAALLTANLGAKIIPPAHLLNC